MCMCAHNQPGESLRMPNLVDMGAMVAAGMVTISFLFSVRKLCTLTAQAYLESKNYIHRDLAARNVLVT